jgi:FtsP/CotA-like multicopper oxidase with cupredoxin domain
MFRAGLNPLEVADQPGPNRNDGHPSESVGTLWYHDHSMDRTAANVYKGLVGFHLLFDEVDSGNENDTNPGAKRLPSGDYDIPLLFQDKRFDANGQLVLAKAEQKNESGFPNTFGVLGDRFTVNGKLQPKLAVKRRKYRFRLLNAGPSRFYQLFLTKEGKDQAFVQIGNDESLLEKPYDIPPHAGVLVSVSERADVIIDFSRYQKGDQLYLVNRLIMEHSGAGPVHETDENGKFVRFKTLEEGRGDLLLRFDVGDDAADPSQVPAKLRDNPELPAEVKNKTPAQLKDLPNHREFKFGFDDGDQGDTWAINGRPFDPSPAGAAVAGLLTLRLAGHVTPRSRFPGEVPDGEIWTIKNADGGNWSHPVHIHLEEFRILWRKIEVSKDMCGNDVFGNGTLPPDYEQCKKDVLRLDPGETVQVFLRFRDFLGKYPIHCHNVLHEDHEMMLRFDVVGDY